jgi:hypothetical protein
VPGVRSRTAKAAKGGLFAKAKLATMSPRGCLAADMGGSQVRVGIEDSLTPKAFWTERVRAYTYPRRPAFLQAVPRAERGKTSVGPSFGQQEAGRAAQP